MKTPDTVHLKTPGTVVFVTRAGAKNPLNSESEKKIPMPGILPPTVPGVVDAPVPGDVFSHAGCFYLPRRVVYSLVMLPLAPWHCTSLITIINYLDKI